ncbi:MAG TPA: LytTR family DNA-binding domain-containing protein [Chitinophagaceae bacterium]|jgi:two-component system LytT family response regulator|nr:LytTR family DNA-binding domain-containing protein [Chitinophagaceae bacterium]
MKTESIKALIIDDEALACDMLEYMIRQHVPIIGPVKKTTSVYEGLNFLKTFEPDLLFLDIQMPFMTGFELLSSLPERPFSVIFTTAYDRYAIKAIRFSALDYLLKPVDPEDLKETMERYILNREKQILLGEQYRNFMYNLRQQEENDYRLSLYTHAGMRLVSTAEIHYCRGENNYTHFHLSDEKTITVSHTIKEYEEMLAGHHFVRVHKSCLVNLAFLKEIKDHTVLMKDGTVLGISRRRRPEVTEAARKYVQGNRKRR